jgi:hypothetical protein
VPSIPESPEPVHTMVNLQNERRDCGVLTMDIWGMHCGPAKWLRSSRIDRNFWPTNCLKDPRGIDGSVLQ